MTLISVEGLDGSGKSTQVSLVKDYISSKKSLAFFHFPMYGHNPASQCISQFLRGEFGGIEEVDPYFVAAIYAMDRFLFLSELNKALDGNDVVLLDRYVFSNLAYQGAKMKDPEGADELRAWIHQLELGFLGLPYPDLTIFLDVPLEIIEKRLSEDRGKREYLNGGWDIHEKDLEFQKRVREGYLDMKGAPNYWVVPCQVNGILLSPEDLFESYKHHIDRFLE